MLYPIKAIDSVMRGFASFYASGENRVIRIKRAEASFKNTSNFYKLDRLTKDIKSMGH